MYVVAVRELCEFVAKRGDLDLRFTPAPTAQEGIAGHQIVAARRGAGYQAEVPLSGDYGPLQVRGRCDGYDPADGRLDEVKTYRGKFGAIPDNHRQLHWAQAKVYGWLMCQQRGLAEIRLALVYFDIGSQKETVLDERHDAESLRGFFEQTCDAFLRWALQETAHRAARDAALTALRFPHEAFRTGQRELAEAVYKAASTGRCMMAQAPTGIGKTIGTIFPLLKAMPAQALDKLFFLAAKTPGRRLALDALGRLTAGEPRPPLRVLELVARDKACEHPDKACHGESCPLARGFYDRLPAAREAATAVPVWDQAALRELALAHAICPYYLSQDLARWADVVVGDYNYYFDLGALLYALTVGNSWRVGVLVDEAHNLVERARKMYSAELDQAALRQLRHTAPEPLNKPLDKLHRRWGELARAQADDYQVYASLPEKLLTALMQASSAITDYLTEHPAHVDPVLQQFYFDALHFSRMAELFDLHSLFDVSKASAPHGRSNATLCLRNLIPGPILAQRFADARTTVLFSATLGPSRYYQDLLGLPADTAWIDVESPFSAEQLSVHVARRISTRYPHRAASAEPICALMAAQYARQPGNYLAYFSSFDYLQLVLAQLTARYPQIPTWAQSRGMPEAEREQFLARFTDDSQGIAFAVLGGAFGEGIDLPGERLIGAFIATLGLPQVNPVNEQIKARMDTVFGTGYDYTYLYPGLQKVVQAAGRVIRTTSDRGVVYLMDDRYARREVRALLPGWWGVRA